MIGDRSTSAWLNYVHKLEAREPRRQLEGEVVSLLRKRHPQLATILERAAKGSLEAKELAAKERRKAQRKQSKPAATCSETVTQL